MNNITVDMIKGYLDRRQNELATERKTKEMNEFNLGESVGALNEIFGMIEFINGIENPNNEKGAKI